MCRYISLERAVIKIEPNHNCPALLWLERTVNSQFVAKGIIYIDCICWAGKNEGSYLPYEYVNGVVLSINYLDNTLGNYYYHYYYYYYYYYYY